LALAGIALVAVFQQAPGTTGGDRSQTGAGGATQLPLAGLPALAGGDPYLAANLLTFRAMLAAGEDPSFRPSSRVIRLLSHANLLNPAHADAYYLSQALLPWSGAVQRAQAILRRAARARSGDWLPVFFRAFNTYYFRHRPQQAARRLRSAAQRAPASQQAGLRAMAARWSVLGSDPREARLLLEGMLKTAGQGELRRVLQARLGQVRGLAALRRAAEAYRRQHPGSPEHLAALKGYGDLEELPEDPLGEGYRIDADGRVTVAGPRRLRNREGSPLAP
jgi:hypothetical protein